MSVCLVSFAFVLPQENYSSDHLVGLFNEMAKTYGVVNLLSSFGFSHFWRKSCIEALSVETDHHCADLMCGMGEGSMMLAERGVASIQAVDFCPAMIERARQTVARRRLKSIAVTAIDVFEIGHNVTYDRVCVAFGIKTLDGGGLGKLAKLLHRLLRPGGRAALVEIHLPQAVWLRRPFLFYLRYVIPLIGRLCLGNPDCYRSLAIYTESFAKRESFADELAKTGLVVSSRALFFGCARLYVAQKDG